MFSVTGFFRLRDLFSAEPWTLLGDLHAQGEVTDSLTWGNDMREALHEPQVLLLIDLARF